MPSDPYPGGFRVDDAGRLIPEHFDTEGTAEVWVLVDRGWEGDLEVLAVYDSENAAEAERKRLHSRQYQVFGPVPCNPPSPDA